MFHLFDTVLLHDRFPLKFERFCVVYIANHLKTKNRRSGLPVRGEEDDSKSCPFNSADHYDPDIHDALANMRRLDGSLPPHERYGQPVNVFAPKGSSKYRSTG